MAELTVPRVDFSPLGDLPDIYRKSQEDAKVRQTLASLGQGGAVDAQTLLKSGVLSLAQLGASMHNREADNAWRLQEAQRTQQNADRSYKLQEGAQARLANPVPEGFVKQSDGSYAPVPGGPQDPAYVQKIAEIKKPNNVLQAGDKKIITAAEDELPTLEGTIDALKIAKDLNSKTFTGVTAGLRGKLGTSGIPGATMLVDKDASMATKEFGQVMSGEAIKTMADTLKGATTDFELKKFEAMMADPVTPPEIRGRMIDRMIKLSEAHKQTKFRRINELRDGTYFKPDGGKPAAPAPSQGNGADTMLKHAKEALAQGADRGAVLMRLQQAGISPDGL